MSSRMRLTPQIATSLFLLFAGVWVLAFMSDAGNFRHGGTAAGLVFTEAAALLGLLAFMDVLRSNVSRMRKAALGVVAAPLMVFSGGAMVYAVRYLVAA